MEMDKDTVKFLWDSYDIVIKGATFVDGVLEIPAGRKAYIVDCNFKNTRAIAYNETFFRIEAEETIP